MRFDCCGGFNCNTQHQHPAQLLERVETDLAIYVTRVIFSFKGQLSLES